MDNLPYEAVIKLPNTAVDNVLFYQSDTKLEEGLVCNMNDTLFISVVTPSFSKGFACTSSSKKSWR